MQKLVVKLNSLVEHKQQKPLMAVSSLQGVVSVELNTKDDKITIIGDMDPVLVAKKLRKWCPKLESFGPAKEEKKPADGDKKPAAGGGDKPKPPTEQELMASYLAHQAHINYATHYAVPYYAENPNPCVIS
ncbi:hypothetical protein V2J09_004775 [Rumex salicifolius]